MSNLHLAFTADYGWMSSCPVICAVVVLLFGIFTIRSAGQTSRNHARPLLAYLFVILAVGAIGVGLHFLQESWFLTAIAKGEQFDPELAALDRSLLAKQDAWFACVVSVGAILGAVAASLSNNAQQAGTGQPATRSELDSEGSDKPQPEAEGRYR
jgi:hypothetical protein